MTSRRARRASVRSNPKERRMTMADVRAANKRAGQFFFETHRPGYHNGRRERFHGPYTGPVGTFFLSHLSKSEDGEEDRFVIFEVKTNGIIWLSRNIGGPLGFAIEQTKTRATGKAPKLAVALRACGVRNPAVVAQTWIQDTQANIIEDMRSMVMPIMVRDWSEMQNFVDANAYGLTPDGEYPGALMDADLDTEKLNFAIGSLVAEIDAWLQSQGHVKALKRLGKKAFRENPRRRSIAAQRSRVRPNGEHELVYVGSLDGKQRTVRPATLVEHHGGDVEFYTAEGFSHRIDSRYVIAVDGVPRKRRASAEDAATLLTMAVLLPKTREHDDERGLDLYRALRANRTLRDALEAAREDYERGRFFLSRPSRRRQDLSLGPSDALDVGRDRHDARGGLHAKDQFARGIVWSAAQRNAVARDLFDAFVAWNLADPEGTYEGREQARLRRGIILSRSSFYAIAHDLYLRNGGSGYRTLTAPEWRWFGMDESDVEHGFFEAHSRGNVWYQAAGSVVELRFLQEPQNTRSNPRSETTHGARRRIA